jgi:hypothetical protein
MAVRADKPFARRQVKRSTILQFSLVVCASISWASSQKPANSDRPQVPFGLTGLSPMQVGVYDSKAQPVAAVLGALTTMNLKGWQTIMRYYPELGVESDKPRKSVNPRDPEDRRFYAAYPNEDPGRSPMPLVAMICALDAKDVSGPLLDLRNELLDATQLPDYPAWTLEQLTKAIHNLTVERTTEKGVKYWAPKPTLTFKQAVQLYAMTVAFLTKDKKWTVWRETGKKLGYSFSSPPDMADFANRLRQQLPILIPPGATRGLLLYRPGWDIAQPRSKEEYEERADVVLIKRSGATFHVEQFPIYLTVDQKAWNPSWITAEDEVKDTTLLARKVEELWTRFDGPYLWYKSDQLNGEDIYKATVKFQKGEILIEAERFVPSRGSVFRTARDPLYDPLNMKRFEAGVERPDEPLTVDLPDLDMWQPFWRQLSRDINETCYRHDDRQLFWYKTGADSWTSSVFPRQDAGPTNLQPIRPANVPSSGIVARYSATDANQPADVQLLTDEQKTSVGIAVGLMNLCLAGSGGPELDALRVSLPRDSDNFTPIYFYSVRNGTAVRKSPGSLVVVLSGGYYNDYVSAFNRMLWVLEKPLENDPDKVSAVNRSIAAFLKDNHPRDANNPANPALVAWSELLQSGRVEQLFNSSILPSSATLNPATPKNETVAAAAGAPVQSGDWLVFTAAEDTKHGAALDPAQSKSAAIAIGLLNLYLSATPDSNADTWKRWYPRGTRIAFLTAVAGEIGSADEERRETTSAQGDKRSQTTVTVRLPARAYAEYPATVVWLLGILEVQARSVGGPSAVTAGGQGTAVSSAVAYLRSTEGDQRDPAVRKLAGMGVDWKNLPLMLPEIPAMFLNAQNAPPETSAPSTPNPGGELRPSIAVLFPTDMGLGQLTAEEQNMVRDVAGLLNLYLNKKEEKTDRLAEPLRRALPPVTNFYLYLDKSEAIHQKEGAKTAVFVGIPIEHATYPGLFLEVLRLLEMQDKRITSSQEKRQDIAVSIRKFLDSYGKENPGNRVIQQLSPLDIKALTIPAAISVTKP